MLPHDPDLIMPHDPALIMPHDPDLSFSAHDASQLQPEGGQWNVHGAAWHSPLTGKISSCLHFQAQSFPEHHTMQHHLYLIQSSLTPHLRQS